MQNHSDGKQILSTGTGYKKKLKIIKIQNGQQTTNSTVVREKLLFTLSARRRRRALHTPPGQPVNKISQHD